MMSARDQETHSSPQILRGSEVSSKPLNGRTIAVLGYGNQGRAHALNLRDSGMLVVVGGRPATDSVRRANDEGFQTNAIEAAISGADLVIVALPDEQHATVWNAQIAPNIQRGQTVGFLHGLSVHFGLLAVPEGVGCVLVAPKGPGATLRDRFVRGQGIPALVAVHQEAADSQAASSRDLALAWAAAIGCARAGVVMTTFRDEAVTDLFGEQSVLCGGMMALARAGFDTLVDAGYPPLLAYIECVQEIKQVADLLYERGPAGMRAAISNAAEYGLFTAQPLIADAHLRQHMQDLLQRVQDGQFARAMMDDFSRGGTWINAQRSAAARDRMELASRDVRALMPWLGSNGDNAS